MIPKIKIRSKEETYALRIVKLFFPSFYETECRGAEDRQDIDGYIPPKSAQVKCDLRMEKTNNLYLQFFYTGDGTTRRIEVKFLADIRIHVCSSFLIWTLTPHLLRISKKYPMINSPPDSWGKLIPISCLAPNYRKIPIPPFLGIE